MIAGMNMRVRSTVWAFVGIGSVFASIVRTKR